MDNTQPNIKNKHSTWIVFGVIAVVVVAAVCVVYGQDLFGQKNIGIDIGITNCDSILPQMATVPIGQSIAFKNNDATSHTIFIGGISIDISGRGVYDLSAKLPYGVGAYSYACDGKLTANQITVTK